MPVCVCKESKSYWCLGAAVRCVRGCLVAWSATPVSVCVDVFVKSTVVLPQVLQGP